MDRASDEDRGPPNSENSVLFSLEALKAASSPVVPEKRPTPPPEDLLALGGGADLEAASMPLIQIEPAQPELAEGAPFRRRSSAAQRGTWLALGGIVALGLGSYFGVQAYLARADTTVESRQTQVRAHLSEAATAAASPNPAPTEAAKSKTHSEGSQRQEADEDEATELDELPKLREVRQSAVKGVSPPAERAPAAGVARASKQPESPAASRPASLEATPHSQPSEHAASPSRTGANEAAPQRDTAPAPDPEASALPAAEPEDSPEANAENAPNASPSTVATESAGGGAASEDEGEAAAPAFNVDAARSALEAAATSAKSCKATDGPTGTGRVLVTFAVSGRVTSARVEGAPFAGTTVGGCVARAFRSASVPAFSGSPQTVAKSFLIK